MPPSSAAASSAAPLAASASAPPAPAAAAGGAAALAVDGDEGRLRRRGRRRTGGCVRWRRGSTRGTGRRGGTSSAGCAAAHQRAEPVRRAELLDALEQRALGAHPPREVRQRRRVARRGPRLARLPLTVSLRRQSSGNGAITRSIAVCHSERSIAAPTACVPAAAFGAEALQTKVVDEARLAEAPPPPPRGRRPSTSRRAARW